MKENDPLKDMFADFNPPMSSTADFMARLDVRLDAVEMIAERTRRSRRRSRVALCVAALAGMVAGALMMALMPYFESVLAGALQLGLAAREYLPLAGWAATAALSVAAAMAAYDISSSLLDRQVCRVG